MTEGSRTTLTLHKGKDGAGGKLEVAIGPLVEPLQRARKWYADAWVLLDKAKATEEQIQVIAKKWNGRALTSPYVWIEARNGEHPSWPNISPTTFAVISACLLVETLRDLAEAEKAGKANDYVSAIGLFWICRYAWNMSKATEVTPAAKKAALSDNAKKAGGLGGKARSANIEPKRAAAMARFKSRPRTERKSRTLAEMEIASGLSRTTVSGIYSKALEAEMQERKGKK